MVVVSFNAISLMPINDPQNTIYKGETRQPIKLSIDCTNRSTVLLNALIVTHLMHYRLSFYDFWTQPVE